MSKINFIGFGGLNEKDRACYALTIDNDIFLLNCGISTPPNAQLGVTKLIPDFSWIINNKNNIRGLFIGTPKHFNFGALSFLLKHIPNIHIYISDIGANLLSSYFEHRGFEYNEEMPRLNFKILTPLISQGVGNVSVIPFKISNYLPNSLGIVFKTNDGSIVFIDDFIINANKTIAFENQLSEINNITGGNNLLLLTTINDMNNNVGFTNPHHRATIFFQNILNKNSDGRTIMVCHEHDLYKVLTAANEANKKGRPIYIHSYSTNNIFDYLCKNNLFKFNKLSYLKEEELENSKDGLIIVVDSPQRLITKLEKIINGEDDIVQILPTDHFVYMVHQINGYEKKVAVMYDQLVRTNVAKIIKMPNSMLLASASGEDHKLLVSMLKPKYIIPIGGLKMNFLKYSSLVSQSYFNKNNLIIAQNGDIVSFVDGNHQKGQKNIRLVSQFVNTSGTIDVGSELIYEKQQMETDGIIIADMLIDKKNKKVVKYNFEQVGVINLTQENEKIVQELNDSCLKLINEYLQKNIKDTTAPLDTREFKYFLRKLFDKHYRKKFNKNPLFLPTLIFLNVPGHKNNFKNKRQGRG